jgi:hypothetical protein
MWLGMGLLIVLGSIYAWVMALGVIAVLVYVFS